MAVISPVPKLQFFDTNGDPLAAGKLYTYEPGTTTNKATYLDGDMSAANANPIVLDARGECVCYLNGPTKMVLKTAADATVWTRDAVAGGSETLAYDLRSYGAVGDGTTDDTTAIQDAIDAVEAAGGGTLVVPAGTFLISSGLTITESNVVLVGQGADSSHDVGTTLDQATSTLKWGGTAGGTMLTISPNSGTGGQRITGCGVKKIAFDAQGAGIGIRIESHRLGEFSDLYFHEFATCGISTGIVAGGLGESEDVQRNTFQRCVSTNTATAANGGLFVLDGNSSLGANTSLNVFMECDARFLNGDAYSLKNCDANIFISCRAIRGAGTGRAIVFHGGDTTADTARHNTFFGFSTNGAITISALGTETYTAASTNNAIWAMDKGNSTPNPTLGTGATCFYFTTEHLTGNLAIVQAAIGDNVTNAEAGRDALGTESLLIRNVSENHVVLEGGTGTASWGVRTKIATGNLEITSVDDAECGDIVLICPSAKRMQIPSAHNVIGALTVTGYIEVKDATGTVRKLAVVS